MDLNLVFGRSRLLPRQELPNVRFGGPPRRINLPITGQSPGLFLFGFLFSFGSILPSLGLGFLVGFPLLFFGHLFLGQVFGFPGTRNANHQHAENDKSRDQSVRHQVFGLVVHQRSIVGGFRYWRAPSRWFSILSGGSQQENHFCNKQTKIGSISPSCQSFPQPLGDFISRFGPDHFGLFAGFHPFDIHIASASSSAPAMIAA